MTNSIEQLAARYIEVTNRNRSLVHVVERDEASEILKEVVVAGKFAEFDSAVYERLSPDARTSLGRLYPDLRWTVSKMFREEMQRTTSFATYNRLFDNFQTQLPGTLSSIPSPCYQGVGEVLDFDANTLRYAAGGLAAVGVGTLLIAVFPGTWVAIGAAMLLGGLLLAVPVIGGTLFTKNAVDYYDADDQAEKDRAEMGMCKGGVILTLSLPLVPKGIVNLKGAALLSGGETAVAVSSLSVDATNAAKNLATRGYQVVEQAGYVVVKGENLRATIPRKTFDWLVRNDQLNEDAVRAIQMERRLRLRRTFSTGYITGRSLDENIGKYLDGTGFNLRKIIEAKYAATQRPVKIVIAGDGDGGTARGLKKLYGRAVEIFNVSLYPVVADDGVYAGQLVRDVTTIGTLPAKMRGADIFLDIMGPAFHGEDKLNAIRLGMDSLAVGGEAFFTTNDTIIIGVAERGVTSMVDYIVASAYERIPPRPVSRAAYQVDLIIPGFKLSVHYQDCAPYADVLVARTGEADADLHSLSTLSF
ncbi:MAG: hypothetical protein HY877_03005 [Deltaproteobacteria bacterium]|nr:hypothetical protein [Deltaproteobacteria bacterium]